MMLEKIQKALEGAKPKSKSIEEHFELFAVNPTQEQVDRDLLIRILESLARDGCSMNEPHLKRILDQFGFHDGLSEKENRLFESIWYENNPKRKNKIESVIEPSTDRDISQLSKDIDSIKTTLKSLNSTEDLKIQELKKALERVETQSKALAAPIKIPSPKNMEVQLVSADSLERLSEYNNDINVFLTLASVFLGACLGMLGNIAFSQSVPVGAYSAIILLGVISIVFGCLYVRSDKRKSDLNKIIFDSDDSVYLEQYKA
ncbi:hypothetical protein [Vibrio cholerae]|uniref:hypothetical protein n=1 Tax=Vibrio cholerae TaxID=666 RepID=UPI0011BDF1AB|nr:hypothetical protein [Vibrio cholerae]MDV2391141.1 hypothetical protein [Vibrio cholerae]